MKRIYEAARGGIAMIAHARARGVLSAARFNRLIESSPERARLRRRASRSPRLALSPQLTRE
jgi:hypothetical protein